LKILLSDSIILLSVNEFILIFPSNLIDVIFSKYLNILCPLSVAKLEIVGLVEKSIVPDCPPYILNKWDL